MAVVISYTLYTIGSVAIWSAEIATTTAALVQQGIQATAYMCMLCIVGKVASSLAPAAAVAPLALRVLWTAVSTMPSDAIPLPLPALAAEGEWGLGPVACTTLTALVGYNLFK